MTPPPRPARQADRVKGWCGWSISPLGSHDARIPPRRLVRDDGGGGGRRQRDRPRGRGERRRQARREELQEGGAAVRRVLARGVLRAVVRALQEPGADVGEGGDAAQVGRAPGRRRRHGEPELGAEVRRQGLPDHRRVRQGQEEAAAVPGRPRAGGHHGLRAERGQVDAAAVGDDGCRVRRHVLAARLHLAHARHGHQGAVPARRWRAAA
mmetsp:Transcript_25150/g.87750  ORF Transcript_25150/g.87750 Transcript_25150/m.87750 type:complete len:210 (+) Transcript_25150:1-630(+)